MDRRNAVLAIAIAAFLLSSVALPFVYPFSTAEPRGAPGNPGFDQGEAEAFTLEGEIVVDGEAVLAVEGAVSSSGERYVRQRWNDTHDVIVERYQENATRGTEYVRVDVAAHEAEWIERYREDAGDAIVSERRDGDRIVFVEVVDEPGGDAADELAGAGSVIANSMEIAAYERAGAAGEGAVALEPRDGWHEEADSWRIADAEGEAVVDEETGALRSADVRWEFTEGASTYVHYLLTESTTHEYEYRYRAEDLTVEPPEWVESVRDED